MCRTFSERVGRCCGRLTLYAIRCTHPCTSRSVGQAKKTLYSSDIRPIKTSAPQSFASRTAQVHKSPSSGVFECRSGEESPLAHRWSGASSRNWSFQVRRSLLLLSAASTSSRASCGVCSLILPRESISFLNSWGLFVRMDEGASVEAVGEVRGPIQKQKIALKTALKIAPKTTPKIVSIFTTKKVLKMAVFISDLFKIEFWCLFRCNIFGIESGPWSGHGKRRKERKEGSKRGLTTKTALPEAVPRGAGDDAGGGVAR